MPIIWEKITRNQPGFWKPLSSPLWSIPKKMTSDAGDDAYQPLLQRLGDPERHAPEEHYKHYLALKFKSLHRDGIDQQTRYD